MIITGLMVDDEPLVGRALVRWLGRRGVELDFVSEPDSFWRKVREGTHRVIALDECLEWDCGSAICSKLRRNGERRAIFLTSHAFTAVVGEALAEGCGADAFVVKTPRAVQRAFESLANLDPCRSPPLAKCRERASYHNAFTGKRVHVEQERVVLEEFAIELSELELDVFAYLLRRAPNIVSASELRREVWKVEAIARSAISNVVGRLIDGVPGDWIERVDGGYRARVIG